MKAKELIAELQKADPTGEAEVAIDNKTVYGTTGVEPGYYDGTYLKVHFSDEAKAATIGLVSLPWKWVPV